MPLDTDPVPDTARTTGDAVRGALGIDDETLTTGELAPFISSAHRLVERRLARHTTDEAALADVETYVAADLVYPLLEDASNGLDARHVEAIEEMDVRIEFDTDAVAAANASGDGNSHYWDTACQLDPTGLLGHADGSWPHSTG